MKRPEICREWLTVPNMLTLSRAIAIPFILAAMSKGNASVATVIFLLAALSDLADGIVARRTDSVTPLGALLDPVADVMLVVAVQMKLFHMGLWPGYLIAGSLVSAFIYGGAFLVMGKKPKCRIGKYVGAVLMASIIVQFAVAYVAPLQWHAFELFLCPMIAGYLFSSVLENILIAAKAVGGKNVTVNAAE